MHIELLNYCPISMLLCARDIGCPEDGYIGTNQVRNRTGFLVFNYTFPMPTVLSRDQINALANKPHQILLNEKELSCLKIKARYQVHR